MSKSLNDSNFELFLTSVGEPSCSQSRHEIVGTWQPDRRIHVILHVLYPFDRKMNLGLQLKLFEQKNQPISKILLPISIHPL